MMRYAIALLSLLGTPPDTSNPRDDLESPLQTVRDSAATMLRKQNPLPPREKWDAVVKKMHVGDPKRSVLKLLEPYHPEDGPGAAGGGSEQPSYRLDDRWMLQCAFDNAPPGKLIARELVEQWRHIWVEPPPNFSGVWTAYFANGQRSHEVHYKSGAYDGLFTSFHSNGQKAVEQTYTAHGIVGEETGWFPSGKVSYRGRYDDKGARLGTWTWFNEDGSVRSTSP